MMRKTYAGLLKEEVHVSDGDAEQTSDSDCAQARIANSFFDLAQNGGTPFDADIKATPLQPVHAVIDAPWSPPVHDALS